MSKSKIEWTEETWNPLKGTKGRWFCNKVSPGCTNCYAERMNVRYGGPKYVDGADTIRLDPDMAVKPIAWKRPRVIFVCSMTDLFHDDVPSDQIGQIFATMAMTPQHTYQVLTKRMDRAKILVKQLGFELDAETSKGQAIRAVHPGFEWPLPNVWLGTSVENQKYANERIPHLLDTPAAVRFLSCEPLLEEVDLLDFPLRDNLHWVIVGGESGPKARPMHPEWATKLRDQCAVAEIPYFFKQWGEWRPLPDDEDVGSRRLHYLRVSATVGDRNAYMVRVGKKKAGRRLDGKLYDEMPDTLSMEGAS